MIGTILLDQKNKQQLPHKDFQSADNVAEKVNDTFGCNLVSGRQLSDTVKKDEIGKPFLHRRGRNRKINDEHMKLLASLVFTAQSIEKANCNPDRLDRGGMTSLLGEIVNDYWSSNDLDEVSDITTYKRIQDMNSYKQDVTAPDKREILWSTWLTYHNQKRHHEKWEAFLVEKGFGHKAETPEEFMKHGHIVFNPGAENYIGHCDEMNFSFNGAKNRKGGQEAAQPTNPHLPEEGIMEEKSGVKCTLLVGASYNDEAYPLMIVLSGKKSESKLLKRQLLDEMHQHEGRWGCSNTKRFSVHIAVTEEGSVQKMEWSQYCQEVIAQCYPRSSDCNIDMQAWSTAYYYVILPMYRTSNCRTVGW